MIWREKRLLLTILGVLLAANTVFFFTYRIQYQNRLEGLDKDLEQVKEDLSAARRSRLAARQQLAAYRKTQQDVQEILQTRWATEEERLTPLIIEVKRLAARSQLAPPTTSYTRIVTAPTSGAAGSSSSRRIGATQVGIGFNVQGTYQQVRRLINYLELSEQFVIIDQIALNSVTGDTLTLNLHVKTLFRDTSAPGARRAGQNL